MLLRVEDVVYQDPADCSGVSTAPLLEVFARVIVQLGGLLLVNRMGAVHAVTPLGKRNAVVTAGAAALALRVVPSRRHLPKDR